MKRVKKWRGILKITVFLMAFCGFMLLGIKADAKVSVEGLTTNVSAPFVSWTADGEAWTIAAPLPEGEEGVLFTNNLKVLPSYWYPYGTVVETGVPLSLPVAGKGQHLYLYDRSGVIPITRWEVVHTTAQCIHGVSMGDSYHGTTGAADYCCCSYYSGWFAICADCGEEYMRFNMYIPIDIVGQLQALDNRYAYYYRCPQPGCGHLEQAPGVKSHSCKGVSYNQYRVEYSGNGVRCTGQANNTYHMYNNVTEYEGKLAVNCTDRLSDNAYGFSKTGYQVIGWDLQPGDPYGTPDFLVGQKLTENLSEDDWRTGEENGTGAGTVTLYAVWAKVEGTLVISPGSSEDIAKGADYNDSGAANATYSSATKSTTVKGQYLTSYVLDSSKLTAPTVGTVTFETNGGSAIAPLVMKRQFVGWRKTIPFYGTYSDTLTKYAFTCTNDGKTDVLTAVWTDGSLVLPAPTKTGDVFGGWYKDPGCTIPVGAAGDLFTPEGDITLYAKWSQLVLYSKTDLTVDGGKGGVDLSWTQEDSRQKFYKIYQKKKGTSEWKQIFSATDVGGGDTLWSGGKIVASSSGTYSVTIPATGFYNIEAYGAQGSDYSTKTGGKGGYAAGRFWLKKGDVITYHVGSRTEGGTGGSGANGSSGGGATTVKSAQLGTLVIAGGGGGASWYQNGGAGGLTSGLLATTEGGNGAAGGGDGYKGGSGGTVVLHTHTTTCYHYHTGDAVSGGGCYVLSSCGGTLKLFEEGGYGNLYTNYPNYENPSPEDCWNYVDDVCAQCALNPCVGGHASYKDDVYKCSTCGTESNSGGTCSIARLKLSCGKTNGQLLCGKTGTVESANPAYGGSSYVNSSYAVWSTQTQGARAGVGYFKIEVVTIGYHDSYQLDDVSAHDEAKPEAISLSSVTIDAAEGTAVLVSFDRPKDNGTVYYHYAESYLAMSQDVILSTTIVSPTYNNIVTGVKRYYYVLNTLENTTVTAANKQAESETNAVKVLVNTQYEQWLHIAAVDAAGNISDTTHVKILPKSVTWDIKTQQITVSPTVGGTDYKGVYQSGTNEYFVKADSKTPFNLSFSSYMEGVASESYQVDNERFEISTNSGASEVFTTILPKSDVTLAGAVILTPGLFSRSMYGDDVLLDVGYSTANRTSYGTACNFAQAFAANASWSGATITVIPHAGATFTNRDGQQDVNWSDETEDAANKVTLVMDGKGPDVFGTGPIEGTEINLVDGDVSMNISAVDDLSGLESITVTVTNVDDGAQRVYTQGANGHVQFVMTVNDAIFNGVFRVEVVARDNVGNETVVKYEPIVLGLTASISKEYDDGLTTYAKGQGAFLNISALGYVDKVIIEWPASILAENPHLVTVIDYSTRKAYLQMEQIPFMIPFGVSDGTILEIPVRAIKGSLEKQERPYIEVQGNILDDIRYRIK